MTPHTAALRWVAGQLAWEDRLGALRDDPETDPVLEVDAADEAVVETLVTATTPSPRSRGRAA